MSRTVMDVKEAAKELGICVPKVRELIKRSDFPAMKIGREWKISRRGLEEWIEEKTKNHEEL